MPLGPRGIQAALPAPPAARSDLGVHPPQRVFLIPAGPLALGVTGAAPASWRAWRGPRRGAELSLVRGLLARLPHGAASETRVIPGGR